MDFKDWDWLKRLEIFLCRNFALATKLVIFIGGGGGHKGLQ